MQPPPPFAVLRGHQASVTSLCFMGPHLSSCSNKCELLIWDIRTRRISKICHSAEDGDDGLLRVVSNDGSLFSNSRLGRIFEYDSEGNLRQEVRTGTSAGFAGCRLLGGELYFPDAFNGRLLVFDSKDGSFFPVADYKNHGMIMDIAVCGTCVSIAVEDATVVVFDSRNSGTPMWKNEMKLNDPIISLAQIDPEKCIVGTSQKEIYKVSQNEKKVLYNMPHPGVDEVTLRDDMKILATAGWDGRIRLFDVKKETPLAVLKHHKGGAHTVAFAPDGLMASAGDDRGIALWSLYRKKQK